MVKKYNYHTHTPRCYHAIGKEEEYVKNAIKAGFEEIGFSDHTPWHYDSDFVSTMRMPLDQLDDYINTIKQLKIKYQDQINIKIGLECEYFERYIPWLKQMLQNKEIDYIILGNHYQHTDEKHIYFGYSLTDDGLIEYVDHCIKAIDTGLYSYIAHPDLANYPSNNLFYYRQMSRLCAYAKKHDIPLEYNLLGVQGNRHYPNEDFWKIASEYKNKVIIGYDAHDPKSLLDNKSFNKALTYLESLDLDITHTIKFLSK